jgi:phage shock protein C
MATAKKKLYRSETNKVLAGVCGGLGEYFDIDPTLVRIAFIVLTVLTGGGIIIYPLMWLLIPSESDVSGSSEKTMNKNIEEMKEKASEVLKGDKK